MSIFTNNFCASGLAVCVFFAASPLFGQMPADTADTPKVASQSIAAPVVEHPLMPVIRWAEKERPNAAAVRDYTALLVKQENINGVIAEPHAMDIKVRHQPFSAYLKFQMPQRMRGQEAIYVEGKNDSKLIGHGVGLEKHFGTQRLDPEGLIAMRGCKYPITQIGILNLIDKLLDVGYKDSKYGECEVKTVEDVKIKLNKDTYRECRLIEVMHPIPRPNFIFYIARIYVDKELNLPIRYESYEHPKESPKLIEAYTYMNLKLNVGLTDADFDPANPAYGYK